MRALRLRECDAGTAISADCEAPAQPWSWPSLRKGHAHCVEPFPLAEACAS
jgi:hypothetical protein